MKVLFAVNDESISTSIVKKYQKDYKEIIQMLKKLAPSDYDFSQVMELDSGYDPSMLKLLTDNETEHRSK